MQNLAPATPIGWGFSFAKYELRNENFPLPVPSRSSIRDERYDRMDKKNDHSRKQGQRYSFIDARAANHCYDFHFFPHPDDSASSERIVTLRCFGERGVKSQRYQLRSGSRWRDRLIAAEEHRRVGGDLALPPLFQLGSGGGLLRVHWVRRVRALRDGSV